MCGCAVGAFFVGMVGGAVGQKRQREASLALERRFAGAPFELEISWEERLVAQGEANC